MAGATRLGSPPDYDPVGASRPTRAVTHSRPSRGKADAYDGASRPTRAATRSWTSQGGTEFYKCHGGASSIAVHLGGNNGEGVPQAVTGRGAQGTTSQEYSGITMALERLAPIITDVDTSRNLRWQQAVAGDPTKLSVWKIEATSSPGPPFYAYMQHGESFMVVKHSMSTIYSTTTDIATLHGKVVFLYGGLQRDPRMHTDCPAPPKRF